MRAWRASFIIATLATLSWSACSTYDEAVAGNGDAGTDATGAGDGTTTADGTAPAGDATVDGSTDAGIDGPFVCTNDFCDDFEGVRLVRGNWTASFASSTTTAAIEAGTYYVTMQQQDAAAMEIVGVGLALDRPWAATDAGKRRRVSISFRALVDCPPAGQPAVMSLGGLGGDVVDIVVEEETGQCFASIREIVPPSTYRFSSGTPIDQSGWHQYVLVLAESDVDAGGNATLTVDGKKVDFVLSTTKAPTNFYALIGLQTGTYQGVVATARFDDVRFDYSK